MTEEPGTPLLIGRSSAVCAVLRQIERIAPSDAPVLIQGETGSGKELVARVVHHRSPRRGKPFIAVNCGAIPDTLIEAELFGHDKGAFTDAKQARSGVIAQAQGGTLFLDEVDTLSPKAQITLLRFLQDLRYRPIGLAREVASDARIMAASNQVLQSLADAGRFRNDLLYRLHIFELVIPPLRRRRDDIELLALHFIRVFSGKYGTAPKRLHPDTLTWLRGHEWPGNVRQLENWVHRELLLADDDEIRRVVDRPRAGDGWCDPAELDRTPLDFRRAKARALAVFESEYLTRVLAEAHGNVTLAARLAGKERRAFGKLLKKHGIDRTLFQAESSAVARASIAAG